MNEVQVPEVGPQEAQEMIARGALLIDVRERNEFAEARIPGARLIPLSEFMTRFTEIPQDVPVVMQCRSGRRSAQTTAFLLAQGYRGVVNLGGGILAWNQQGLPVDTTPKDPSTL
ncbi:Inner membrane protein YgaP [Calidithermus terrae]|uniref:Inner membrane protein YgaP n=1 Tax=Calidithermus terrae TaxID=1408545 RepID=A0A399EYD2_9DEIN|nr:rhodanese-like domain-containing protein [Calidithermus terrae]RIH88773.1 Inner membrane protein YgaP [Calidithermus terrae]